MRLPAVRLRPSTLAYLAVAIAASAPAWIVKYPPMQDLPFHLATIRIIHDFHNPAFGFDHDFVLTLGRTQYIIYYIIGSVLATFVGVVAANVLLVSGYLGGTVLALRSLLEAFGKSGRLSLLVIPLLVNVMFMYGLFPFLLGIPIMFWALATAVRHFERPTLRRGAMLGVLALALFYSHVFPFGIFCLGFAAMFPWLKPREWLRAATPLVPAVLVLGWWTFFTAAGKLTRGAITDSKGDPHKPIDQAIGDIHNWFTNVFRDTSDETILVALVMLVVLTVGLAQGDREKSKPALRAYALLPIACIVLYFTSTEGHGYIWLIAQRFPILFAMTAIPLVPMPSGGRGALVTLGALAVGAASTVNTCKHFIQFQLDEVGDVDDALAEMDPRSRVCALIYDKGSVVVNNQPFLHFGSYYQVRSGGIVMFTYAGYAHWPIDFQPGHYPPPGGPGRLRWEWTPEQVPVLGEIYPYYDFVLTRGDGFRPPPGTYHLKWHGERWAVWARDAR